MKVIEKRNKGNSVVRIVCRNGEKYVEKKYHIKFTVDDEISGYKELNKVMSDIERARTCNVVKEVSDKSAIRLEHIDCPLLYNCIFKDDDKDAYLILGIIVDVCVKSKRMGYTFDLDPKNIFLCIDENKPFLVVIDPPCINTNIDDHNAVVFFIGVLKSFVRYGLYRPIRSLGIIVFFVKRYIHRSELTLKRFMGQAATYARIVASWNYDPDEAGGESILGMRRVVLSAAWMSVSFVLLSIGFVDGMLE
jgi:hypothetical protein